MLALAEWRSRQCESCGGDLTDTLTHEDWEPIPPVRCHKCRAIHIGQDSMRDDIDPLSLRWGAKHRGW
jgi:hypothetical protein